MFKIYKFSDLCSDHLRISAKEIFNEKICFVISTFVSSLRNFNGLRRKL